MAETADRSVTARAFSFLIEVFGTRKCRFWRVPLKEDPLSSFGVDVWLEGLTLATARAQG